MMRRSPRALLGMVLAAATLSLVPASADAATQPNCNDFSARFRTPTPTYPFIWLPSFLDRTGCVMGTWMDGTYYQSVRILQLALNECYGAGLRVDGYFGPLTKAALQNAQSRAGARVDGVYGPETRDKIRWPKEGTTGCDRGSYYPYFR